MNDSILPNTKKCVHIVMTHGVLGIIACPMVDDNLVYSISKDEEEKFISVISNGNEGTVTKKLDKCGIKYKKIVWEDVVNRKYRPEDGYNIIILMLPLGLHAEPKKLKDAVEDYTRQFQPIVDGIGFYLGTCGNYNWDIPAWCSGNEMKPSATFRDKNGELCHDCVGVNIAGGPRYLELEKKYAGHLFMFPAMAVNYDEFMHADNEEAMRTEESITDEMREELGIEPGRDGYMRWLLRLGGYQYLLRIDTGLGDEKEYDEKVKEVSERTQLDIKVAEPGWADLQPTDDLYSECKSFLKQP